MLSVTPGLALDEGDVVTVGTGGTCQDAHEVTVIAEVFEKAWHPSEHASRMKKISVNVLLHNQKLQRYRRLYMLRELGKQFMLYPK